MPPHAFDTPSHGRVYDLFTTRRQSGGFSNVSQENPPRCNYSGTGPVGGVRPKGEDLWPVGAFEGFMHGPHGDRSGDTNGVPDELVLGGFARWSTITLGARAAWTLWVGGAGIQNDTIRGALRNLAHIVFDSDTQRTAGALDDQFLGAQYCNLSDGGPIGARPNYSRSHVQCERFRIGS